MNEMDFETQINRLNSQWPRTYGGERKTLLWAGLQKVDEEDLRAAVDSLLMSQRAAPMFSDLDRAVNEAKARRLSGVRRGGGFSQVLEEAAAKDEGSDREFVRACLTHLNRYLNKQRIVKKRVVVDEADRLSFYEGCDAIDNIANRLNPKGRRPGSQVVLRKPDPRQNRVGDERE